MLVSKSLQWYKASVEMEMMMMMVIFFIILKFLAVIFPINNSEVSLTHRVQV